MEYKLKRYFNKLGIDDSLDVDFSIDAEFIEDYMIEDLCMLEDYFGRGMDEPRFHVYNLYVKTKNIYSSKQHKSFYFFHNDIKFLIFDKDGTKYDELVGWGEGYTYEVIGKPKIEEFNGERYVQLIVEEIEVLDKDDNNIDSEEEDLFGNGDDEEEFEW